MYVTGIQLGLESIRLGKSTGKRVSVYKEIKGDRCLAMYIGRKDAQALLLAARSNSEPLAFVQQFLWKVWELSWAFGIWNKFLKIKNMVAWRDRFMIVFGGVLNHITITDIIDGAYQTEIKLVNYQNKLFPIKIRPSEGFCIAVRYGLPIYASREVMEEYGARWEPGEDASAVR